MSSPPQKGLGAAQKPPQQIQQQPKVRKKLDPILPHSYEESKDNSTGLRALTQSNQSLEKKQLDLQRQITFGLPHQEIDKQQQSAVDGSVSQNKQSATLINSAAKLMSRSISQNSENKPKSASTRERLAQKIKTESEQKGGPIVTGADAHMLMSASKDKSQRNGEKSKERYSESLSEAARNLINTHSPPKESQQDDSGSQKLQKQMQQQMMSEQRESVESKEQKEETVNQDQLEQGDQKKQVSIESESLAKSENLEGAEQRDNDQYQLVPIRQRRPRQTEEGSQSNLDDQESQLTFSNHPNQARKRSRHTVYFENIVNNYIYIDEREDQLQQAQTAFESQSQPQLSQQSQNSQERNIDINAVVQEAQEFGVPKKVHSEKIQHVYKVPSNGHPHPSQLCKCAQQMPQQPNPPFHNGGMYMMPHQNPSHHDPRFHHPPPFYPPPHHAQQPPHVLPQYHGFPGPQHFHFYPPGYPHQPIPPQPFHHSGMHHPVPGFHHQHPHHHSPAQASAPQGMYHPGGPPPGGPHYDHGHMHQYLPHPSHFGPPQGYYPRQSQRDDAVSSSDGDASKSSVIEDAVDNDVAASQRDHQRRNSNAAVEGTITGRSRRLSEDCSPDETGNDNNRAEGDTRQVQRRSQRAPSSQKRSCSNHIQNQSSKGDQISSRNAAQRSSQRLDYDSQTLIQSSSSVEESRSMRSHRSRSQMMHNNNINNKHHERSASQSGGHQSVVGHLHNNQRSQRSEKNNNFKTSSEKKSSHDSISNSQHHLPVFDHQVPIEPNYLRDSHQHMFKSVGGPSSQAFVADHDSVVFKEPKPRGGIGASVDNGNRQAMMAGSSAVTTQEKSQSQSQTSQDQLQQQHQLQMRSSPVANINKSAQRSFSAAQSVYELTPLGKDSKSQTPMSRMLQSSSNTSPIMQQDKESREDVDFQSEHRRALKIMEILTPTEPIVPASAVVANMQESEDISPRILAQFQSITQRNSIEPLTRGQKDANNGQSVSKYFF